jgi:peptidoglycan lytic transglycosylase G
MKRRNSGFCILLPTMAVILILVGGAITWAVKSIFDYATTTYGPPAPALTLVQKLTYTTQLVYNAKDLTQSVDKNGQSQSFKVDLGEPVVSVATRLEQAGLIRNADIFRIYLIYAGLDTRIQAGNYEINPSMPAIAIANRLMDATPEKVTFNILAGWRAEEIAAALPTSGLSITPQEFLDAIQNPPVGIPIRQPKPEILTMEGFLFPDSYEFARTIPLKQMLIAILENFDRHVTADIQQGFSNQGLSLYQGVTLASIVQREALVTDEQPTIASVFFNRLANGMKLDSDPTVQYSLGYNQIQKTWWTNPLYADDLQVASAFNTYLNAGLPPGPIANPGISALQAVAHPAKTPYYYFRARCDGSGKHTFAVTYEEHLQNACP